MIGKGLRRRRAIAAAIASTLLGGVSLAGAAGTPPRAPGTTGITQAAAEQLGLQAYEYGIPLIEFAHQAAQQTSVTVPNALSDAPVNQLGNARQLATAAHQVIVQPNNDTLYTMGHLDLTHTALVLHVPAVSGHRYYSFEFLDPYTDVFHYIGTRTTGDGAGNFLITGPGFHGTVPIGVKRIRCAYDRAWLVGRTLVNGQSDLPAVHRVQNGYKLIPLVDFRAHGLRWTPTRPAKVVTRHRDVPLPTGVAFFDALGTELAQNPPPPRDAPLLAKLRAVGIGPGLRPSAEHLSSAILAGLADAVQQGPSAVFALRTSIAAKSVVAHNGWFVPPEINGAYGTDYAYRAVVALNGLAANRPAEALYIVGVASTAGLLTAGHDYVIHFAAGHLPPARYFWSLTMYDKNFYLVPNALNRYALGSDTPGLRRNPDGSLDIYVSHSRPAGHVSNWLPAPATGTFEITMRLYGPRANALRGTYVYPPITETS